MWRSRMLWRLFLVYSAIVLSSIVLMGFIIVHRVEEQFLAQIESSLHTKAVLVREIVRERPAERASLLQEHVVALRDEIATRITLIGDDGRVLADSEENPEAMENHGERPEVRAAREVQFGSATRFSDTVGQTMMYAALRTNPNHGGVAFVRVALPLNRVQEQLVWLRRLVWSTAAVTCLGAMVLAFWLARRMALPLQELTQGAERIAAGGYGHRVYVPRHDEFGVLAQSFNHMSERLADQFAQLQQDHQQLRAILGGMVEGVVALDAEQRILFANDRAAQLLEFQIQTAVGRKLWEVVRQRPIHEIVRCALAESGCRCAELNWNGPATKSLTVHVAQLPDSPTRGAVLVLHDTSELRRLERVRQEFVANVSHELKTPLSVIKACVETLLDGAINDPKHRGPFLEQIADQAERLHALILDLLSLARIESGTEVFEKESVPLKPVVAACLERYRARAEAKNLLLEVGSLSSPEQNGEPLAVWADEEAVGQILDNLVDNALKYTSSGGRVGVRCWAEDGVACLEVEDSGIGIPEKDLPHIFERFYRVDKARSRELGGTGLGLSIVKHLVQAMQGSVRASSQLGEGTRFVVRLPRSEAVSQRRPRRQSSASL